MSSLSTDSGYAYAVAHHCTVTAVPALNCEGLGYLTRAGNTYSALEITLDLLPLAVGVFLGAPLAARELEGGLFRFTWTQSTGRRRYVLSGFALSAAVVVVVAVLLALEFDWYSHPFRALGEVTSWKSGAFLTTPFILPIWSLFGLTLGFVMGVVVRRTVAAMLVTTVVAGAATLGLETAIMKWAESLGALVRRGVSTTPWIGSMNYASYPGSGVRGGWIVRGFLEKASGHVVAQGTALAVQSRMWSAFGSGQPKAAQLTAWLHRRGYSYFQAYQPQDRFWIFQVGVGIALLLATGIVLFAGLSLVRRGASR